MAAFSFERVRINWFPSHMRRALDKMERILNRVDMIIEVRDARIPISSNNERFEQLLKKKQRIIVFNKKDLAEENTNKVGPICIFIIVYRNWQTWQKIFHFS